MEDLWKDAPREEAEPPGRTAGSLFESFSGGAANVAGALVALMVLLLALHVLP